MNKSDFEKLPLVVEGETVIHPCVEILALSTTPKVEDPAGFSRFFEAFERRYADKLTHYRLNDSTKWRKIRSKDRGKVSGWFSDSRSLVEPELGVDMHTHAQGDKPCPPMCQTFFDHVHEEYPRGMCRIILPVDQVDDDAADLLALVDDAMSNFPIHWGSAGYSFYWESLDSTVDHYADQWIGRHLYKHPGLSPGTSMDALLSVEQGVSNIGWLTFLGKELIEKLGGIQTLDFAVKDAKLALRRYEKGVAIQAGPVPELGNNELGDRLAAYSAVGSIIEPVFARMEKLKEMSVKGYDDDEEMLEWLRRFLP